MPSEDDIPAVRFDALLYGIELGYIAGNKYTKGIKDLMAKVGALSHCGTIPAVQQQKEFIKQILSTDYVETAGIPEFENIRTKIRDLIKYIPRDENPIYHTDFTDDIVAINWRASELNNDDLQNYKMKVNHYIRSHMNEASIAKLHTNQPLSADDIHALEQILWSELGTKEDYAKEYQDKPLGELVREIVGLDMNAAKEAFSKYLNDVNMDDRQIYFVNQIINYIVQNGMMKNFAVMQEPPFNDKGDVADIFTDTVVWLDIMRIIKSINKNATVMQ